MVDCTGREIQIGNLIIEHQGRYIKIGVITKITPSMLRYTFQQNHPKGVLAKPNNVLKLSEQQVIEILEDQDTYTYVHSGFKDFIMELYHEINTIE